MKKLSESILLFIITLLILTNCNNSVSENKTEIIKSNGLVIAKFKVWGNCEMCKETIENAIKINGIKKADWNIENKIISITFDEKTISLTEIQKQIANVGYDNVSFKGNDSAYLQLHECCQYERK